MNPQLGVTHVMFLFVLKLVNRTPKHALNFITQTRPTGFRLFELIFGRDVRGPLDVLKKGWSTQGEEEDSIVEYVSRVRKRMEFARE